MTLSNRIYLRRNGALLFWRLGRVGGSVYISSNTSCEETRSIDRAITRTKRRNMRREFYRLRRCYAAALSNQA